MLLVHLSSYFGVTRKTNFDKLAFYDCLVLLMPETASERRLAVRLTVDILLQSSMLEKSVS